MAYSEDQHIVVNHTQIEQILNGSAEITDILEIEDALIIIQSAQKKIEFLKHLKKRRAELIESEIERQQNRVSILKQSIMNCMAKNQEKTLDFTGTAKVSLRKAKGLWTINDEEQLANQLRKLGKFDDVGSVVIKFDKTQLNKLLNELEKNNNVPNSVAREEESDGLTISFKETSRPIESIDDMLDNSIRNENLIPAEKRQRQFDKLDI